MNGNKYNIKMDLNNVNDGLNGFWWNYIDSENFNFLNNVPQNDVKDDDILIHKEIKEGDRFPTLRYHTVLADEVLEINGKEARKILARKLTEFILKHKKLPDSCDFKKIQKNGLVIFKYSPTAFDNFQLKIPLGDFDLELELDEAEEFFSKIENIDGKTGTGSKKIKLMKENPVIEQIASESGTNRVYIFHAEVKGLEKRTSEYMGHISEFYLVDLQKGTAAPDAKKKTMKRDFDRVIAKISQNTINTEGIKVGDIVSLSGKTKSDKFLKFIVQNVRKITKES
ncbi:MAG: hypothetical protein ACTSXY_08870 [Promethearchaeota archaeon]